jgi:hypothetical protein
MGHLGTGVSYTLAMHERDEMMAVSENMNQLLSDLETLITDFLQFAFDSHLVSVLSDLCLVLSLERGHVIENLFTIVRKEF